MGFAPGEGETRPAGVQRADTGDSRVDDALSRLDDLAELPLAEHPAVFGYVQERLAEALGDLDVRDRVQPGQEPGAGSSSGAGGAVGSVPGGAGGGAGGSVPGGASGEGRSGPGSAGR